MGEKNWITSVFCDAIVFCVTIIYGLALDIITCSWVLGNSIPCIKPWFKKVTIQIFENNICSNKPLTLFFNSSYFSASVCYEVN